MSHPSFPGNIPAGGAATFSGWARNGQKPTPDDLTPEAQAYREYAQIQATLALAYEQRTANLLKVLELQGRMHDAQQAFNLSASDVAERLGMRAEK